MDNIEKKVYEIKYCNSINHEILKMYVIETSLLRAYDLFKNGDGSDINSYILGIEELGPYIERKEDYIT